MAHINAPLTPAGRLRMVLRHIEDGIPKAHVAAEFRVSRPTVTTWVARCLESGEAVLMDHRSTPMRSRTRASAAVIELIEALRRRHKWSARRIHRHLLDRDVTTSLRIVGRWLHRLGISRLRDLTPQDPGTHPHRLARRLWSTWMLRRSGGFPTVAAGGPMREAPSKPWPVNAHTSSGWATPTSTRPSTGSPAWPTPNHWKTRRQPPPLGSSPTPGLFRRSRHREDPSGGHRQWVQLSRRGLHPHRRGSGLQHHRIRAYTPRHNGKVERYNRLMVDEVLYARVYDSEHARRQALQVWVNYYNYCESWGGWSGTGWQGGHRAAAALRS